jgi:hypothetical protein
LQLVGERLPIRRFKSVSFSVEGHEQNAEKPDRWGRSGGREWKVRTVIQLISQQNETIRIAERERTQQHAFERRKKSRC